MNPRKPINLWPISIIAFFVIAISFLVSYTIWAMRQREDLVSPDYYEKEVRYQRQLDSMNRSTSIATQVAVTFEPARRQIVITLPAGLMASQGDIYLYRPSDARLDRQFPLALDAEGRQRLDAKDLPAGYWKVRVRWMAGGQEYYLDQAVIVTTG